MHLGDCQGCTQAGAHQMHACHRHLGATPPPPSPAYTTMAAAPSKRPCAMHCLATAGRASRRRRRCWLSIPSSCKSSSVVNLCQAGKPCSRSFVQLCTCTYRQPLCSSNSDACPEQQHDGQEGSPPFGSSRTHAATYSGAQQPAASRSTSSQRPLPPSILHRLRRLSCIPGSAVSASGKPAARPSTARRAASWAMGSTSADSQNPAQERVRVGSRSNCRAGLQGWPQPNSQLGDGRTQGTHCCTRGPQASAAAWPRRPQSCRSEAAQTRLRAVLPAEELSGALGKGRHTCK